MATAVSNEVATGHFGQLFKLPRHCTMLAMVERSNVGVVGWANWNTGDADVFGDPGDFPRFRCKREVE